MNGNGAGSRSSSGRAEVGGSALQRSASPTEADQGSRPEGTRQRRGSVERPEAGASEANSGVLGLEIGG
ncbi:hypothetical protein E2562_032877 [Oryza meyeriana var. granulata]|uniref:Uncharacterized protein n=1 Tax=Oryza meyeriana var. granulata TaxID=110450 RepID=A0A6G1F0M8_9ORYZ|nr:hypothetical protein E2562_032877 [Oryza meyeriana var. granulata]